MWDRLWTNAHLATMAPAVNAPYGAITNGAIAVKDGRIAWLGAEADLPGAPETLAQEAINAEGAWITPGLVDCHTHLVFGGDRTAEFEARLNGASYEEIARAGGGILSTVAATRAAGEDELAESAGTRLHDMRRQGVTTVEIKSGYGLDTQTETKMLRAAGRLGQRFPVRVQRTFLGAHALPPEYEDDRSGYVDLICEEMLPAIAEDKLADAVDAFCESIGFTPDEVRKVFDKATALGLRVKLHAEQLSDSGGCALAAEFNALSADHLEYLSADGVNAMAKAGTTAVLLPGAFYTLRETRMPPIEALRAAGVAIAVASDCNPGSSPIVSPLTILNMACTLLRLPPEEALKGMTLHGARALGLADETGSLEIGKAADFALWSIDQPAELCYWLGAQPLRALIFNGADRTPD